MAPARVLGLSASLMGAHGVAAAAYGSHKLRQTADEDQMRLWNTAVQYQTTHAVAAFAAAAALRANPAFSGRTSLRVAATLWTCGTIAFSGAIYARVLESDLATTLAPELRMMAPIGGGTLIAGWLLAGLAFI